MIYKNPELVKKLKKKRRFQLACVVGLITLAFTLLFYVDNMLISFILAFVTHYLMAPLVHWIERRGVSRQTAILIPYCLTSFLICLGIYLLLPMIASQMATLESKLPLYQTQFLSLLNRMELRFTSFLKVYNINVSQGLNTWLITKTADLSAWIPMAISKSLTVLLLSPILAFFMLRDGQKISRQVLALVPNNLFETALKLKHQINDQMGGFIRARLLESSIVAIVVWIGLAIIDFPYSPLLAFFAGLTNIIPYIGPIFGAAPAVIIASVSPEGRVIDSITLNLTLVASIYLIAQLIDLLFIIPMVVARIVNLHPVTVILVMIIGAQFMGILGMVICIPVASAIKLTVQAIYDQVLDFKI